MASFITAWWYSLQNILLVAPSVAPRSLRFCTTAVSERNPLIRMICTLDQARASSWRTSGSASRPLALALSMMASSSFSKRR